MISYWEQQSFLSYGCIVIGAGIVGLSTAIELKEKYPHSKVLVLERGWLPSGASTRNAGFAATGSFTELIDDLSQHSEQEVVSLFAKRLNGLQILRDRLGDKQLDYKSDGSHELLIQQELPLLERLDEINHLLRAVIDKNVFATANEKIESFGFDKSIVKSLVSNSTEGQIHTGKMMRSLTELALQKGIEIKTGFEVSWFEEKNDEVEIFFNDTYRKEKIALKCEQLFICTNAFTPQLIPDVDVVPGRGQVIVTKPIQGLRVKGIFHFDKGYYYFREIDGRILLGGGRNKDFVTETTTEFELNHVIQNDLEEKLNNMILPMHSNIEIEYRWAGIMAFGKSSKTPVVRRFSLRTFGAFRLSGIGVAVGSAVAKDLIALLD